MKFIKYIKGHKVILIFIGGFLVLTIIAIPMIINFLFKLPAPTSFFAAEWGAGEVLSYYGSLFSCISTIIFSGLALWQNHLVQEENNKYSKLVLTMDKEKNAPHFVIEKTLFMAAEEKIDLTIHNVSNNPAQMVTIKDFVVDNTPRMVDQIIIDFMAPQSSSKQTIHMNRLTGIKDVAFSLTYIDVFGEMHQSEVAGKVNNERKEIFFRVAEKRSPETKI